jgi:hypothetical protein
MLGPRWVYPVLKEYITANSLKLSAAVELYKEDEGEIDYRFYQSFQPSW